MAEPVIPEPIDPPVEADLREIARELDVALPHPPGGRPAGATGDGRRE